MTRAPGRKRTTATPLTEDEKKFFSGLNQVKHVLMLGENWCGDVHRNSPMIARIVEAMPGAEMRVFLRDQNVDLTDCFLNNGYRSIPIVVFFDKDWNEVGRWIERAGTATEKSFAIRAVTLDVATEDKKDAAMAEFRKQVQARVRRAGRRALARRRPPRSGCCSRRSSVSPRSKRHPRGATARSSAVVVALAIDRCQIVEALLDVVGKGRIRRARPSPSCSGRLAPTIGDVIAGFDRTHAPRMCQRDAASAASA